LNERDPIPRHRKFHVAGGGAYSLRDRSGTGIARAMVFGGVGLRRDTDGHLRRQSGLKECLYQLIQGPGRTIDRRVLRVRVLDKRVPHLPAGIATPFSEQQGRQSRLTALSRVLLLTITPISPTPELRTWNDALAVSAASRSAVPVPCRTGQFPTAHRFLGWGWCSARR